MKKEEHIDNVHNTTHQKEEEDKPMNIILFYADDWRHDTLGAAGNPIVKTPVLDALAEEGIRFTENCVTTSICWVSRVTLYSCLLYTSPSPRDRQKSRMPSSA